MLQVLGIEASGDELDLSFRRPPLSQRSGLPILVGMGDSEAGPLVGLFYDGPATPEQLAGPPDLTPAHSHPCDNFRIVMRGELIVGQERYHQGQFRLQRSGRPYGRDGDAPHPEGSWRIIFFADRRGHRVRPTNPELRARYASPEAVAQTRARFGDVLPVVLDDADDGVDGLVTTIDRPFSRLGHIDGSFEDAEGWPEVGNGAHMAVSLLGVHELGPVVVLQRTPPASPATPSCTFASDVFRCVIRGSARRAGRIDEQGDATLRAAGVPWEAVDAGPDGLDELLIIGDRRGGVPTGGGAWAATLGGHIDRLQAGLATLPS